LAARPILIAQISDLHITRPDALAYGRVDSAPALLRTISTLNNLSPRPDLVVISGDITDSALPEEYAHATKLLGALQMPFVAILGNHDRRALFRETFPDPACGAPDCALNTVRCIDELDIFLIDSTVAGAWWTHRRLGDLTKRSMRPPRDLRSSFCIILRSTREFRIRKCGYSSRASGGISWTLFLRLRRNDPTPDLRPNFWAKRAALSSVTFSAYIPFCRGNLAMAINGRRNKPIGPGGSTRRLHQSPASTGFGGGETGSTRA